jgi:ribonucleoside-diphosphate reductase alpha chain
MNTAMCQDKIDTHMTRQEAIQECLKEVKNELAAKVLVDKYFLCDEKGYYETQPQQMWSRLAKANAQAEEETKRKQYEQEFKRILDDFKFVPGGRILYGLGNKIVNTTLKNCYVIAIQEDSIKGIFDAAYKMAETYKQGGGCGIDISILRPKGSPIKNAARESAGSVSFMDFYSHITGMIGQKARIGALLISLDVSHPDIEDFINIKGGDDLDKVRFANISVKITDEFMKAVENNADFDLRWGGKVYRTVKASKLWDKIINKAWKRAEPGILFWDTACRNGPSHNYKNFNLITTNPCVSGDTRILTSQGYRTARELWIKGDYTEYSDIISDIDGEVGELQIINKNGVVPSTCVYRTSECADVFRVTLKNGIEIDATENHKFILSDNTRRTLAELRVGDKLPINQQQIFGEYNYPEYARLAGWIIVKGSVSYRRDGQMDALVRCWGPDIENVAPVLRQDLLSVYHRSNKSIALCSSGYSGYDSTPNGFDTRVLTMQSSILGRLLHEDSLEPGKKHHVPESLWGGDKETVSAFLSGLFSADGGVQISNYKKSISIRICQVNKSILSECQLLLNQFGITSSVLLRRKAGKKLMNDGKGGKKLYQKKTEYELIISGRCNCMSFIEQIGFIQDGKNKVASNWFDVHHGSNNSEPKKHSKIKSIEYLGKQETFCLTEPKEHEIVANTMRIAQCGEIGLSDGDSCNLGSMNLSKYVASPFTDASRFNFDGFERDVKSSIRFLDNIISLEKSPLEFQQWANDNGRRLGLGVMGMADMLTKLRIRYDSKESLGFLEKLFDSLMCASYTASCDLAEEKGPFSVFDYNTHMKSEFTQRLPKPILDRMKSTGLRNISLNAIAPTGTLALIAQCSASIEPVFMNHYIRKTTLGTAKKVEEHKVYHPTVQEYLGIHGGELPDYFVEAHNVDPLFRTVVQGMIQGKIDNSISQTINLPSDATEKDVSDCYMNAWKKGCKGITVYRDGSREGVLVKESDARVSEIVVHQAPQRPKELPARVHVIKPNGMEYAIFVGFLNNRIYEVFALDNNDVGVKDGVKGKIKKVSADNGNVYVFENRAMFVNQLNRYEDSDASLITRLLSTALRHGTPLEFVIDQVSKSKAIVNSFAKAIARALSLYIKPEEVVGKFKCPECKSTDLKYEGTCFSCLSCGYSKCT